MCGFKAGDGKRRKSATPKTEETRRTAGKKQAPAQALGRETAPAALQASPASSAAQATKLGTPQLTAREQALTEEDMADPKARSVMRSKQWDGRPTRSGERGPGDR